MVKLVGGNLSIEQQAFIHYPWSQQREGRVKFMMEQGLTVEQATELEDNYWKNFKLSLENILSSPPIPHQTRDSFKDGIRAAFDFITVSCAFNYHGNPNIQEICDIENHYVTQLAKRMLAECSPDAMDEWRKLSEEISARQEAEKQIIGLQGKVKFYKDACIKMADEVSQTLGKVLGYPWYKDDQKTFPNAVEADGVCVGDAVAESLAEQAANRIKELNGLMIGIEIALSRDEDIPGAMRLVTSYTKKLRKDILG